ncbi:DMT family transporter [Brenneria izbisi]|uniref:DMT family transporter n=1 Tax=Brenneria izbisi TaxID=2939450 RepID=A0AA41XX11_9GAMM|nr:DMT family transporter [Brenneria izbisi]MCV9878111.1 DMT family transporter [Brenneria izbisi]MCV9881325.1 DMT family transporter [Brenneria izbisi]
MITFIILALFNGVCISLSRSINGRLSMERNAFYASLWNHIVGFVFLTLIIVVQSDGFSSFHFNAPFYAYLGGALGALFVAINSYVLPRIGSTQAAMLIISGQMISGVVIDQISHPSDTIWISVLAVVLIVAGIWVSKISAARKSAQTINLSR